MALEDFNFDTNDHKDPEFEDNDNGNDNIEHNHEDKNYEYDQNKYDDQSNVKLNKNSIIKKLRRKSTSQQIKKQENIKIWKENFTKNVSYFLASCLIEQV